MILNRARGIGYARSAMNDRSRLFAAALLFAVFACLGRAQAERNTLGPHLGYKFDDGGALLAGAEGRFDVANIGQSAIVQLNPSFSLYFPPHNVTLNFAFNVPFEFLIHDSVLRPFAAPGIGIYHSTARNAGTTARLNLIGGLLFHLQALEPFIQLRFVCGDGISPELMGGLLFRL